MSIQGIQKSFWAQTNSWCISVENGKLGKRSVIQPLFGGKNDDPLSDVDALIEWYKNLKVNQEITDLEEIREKLKLFLEEERKQK